MPMGTSRDTDRNMDALQQGDANAAAAAAAPAAVVDRRCGLLPGSSTPACNNCHNTNMAFVLHRQNQTSSMHCVLHPVHLKQIATVAPRTAHMVTGEAHELAALPLQRTIIYYGWLVASACCWGCTGSAGTTGALSCIAPCPHRNAVPVKCLARFVAELARHGTHRDDSVGLFGTQTVSGWRCFKPFQPSEKAEDRGVEQRDRIEYADDSDQNESPAASLAVCWVCGILGSRTPIGHAFAVVLDRAAVGSVVPLEALRA